MLLILSRYNNQGRPTGEAEVAFSSAQDAKRSLQKDRQNMQVIVTDTAINSWKVSSVSDHSCQILHEDWSLGLSFSAGYRYNKLTETSLSIPVWNLQHRYVELFYDGPDPDQGGGGQGGYGGPGGMGSGMGGGMGGGGGGGGGFGGKMHFLRTV